MDVLCPEWSLRPVENSMGAVMFKSAFLLLTGCSKYLQCTFFVAHHGLIIVLIPKVNTFVCICNRRNSSHPCSWARALLMMCQKPIVFFCGFFLMKLVYPLPLSFYFRYISQLGIHALYLRNSLLSEWIDFVLNNFVESVNSWWQRRPVFPLQQAFF